MNVQNLQSILVVVGQLKSQLAQCQCKCDKQAGDISLLQQMMVIQTVQGEQKFNKFLVCANQYEQSKAKEIEALKLKLMQQEHIINSIRACDPIGPHPMNRHFAGHNDTRYQLNRDSPTSSSSNSSGAAYFEDMTVRQMEQLRVRQKNIMYIIGLPVSLCHANLLKSNKWFGKFGAISRISFNTSPKCVKANSIPTFVTYVEERDALQAILKMNLYCLPDSTRLKTNFGRTRYCQFFCRKEACMLEKCKLLHSWADHDDLISEQEIANFNAICAGPPSRFNRK